MPAGVVHSARSSRGHGPGAVRVAQEHPRRVDAEAPQHLAHADQPAAAQRLAREVAVDRPEPGGVERRDRRRVARAERGGAQRALAPALPRQRHPGARRRARAAGHRPVLRALDERVHPRVDRRERGLVVVGGRVVLGQVDDPARHRAGREALEGRHGRVDVGVVAVDRVDVVAQPDAGVGELDARGRGLLGEPRGERAGVGRLDPLLEAEEAGRLGLQAAVDPARDEPVVVVAARRSELAVGAERAPELGEHRRGDLGGVALRRLAQLERVAEDHEAVVARRPPRAAARAAPGGAAGRRRGGAEVEVGDDERAHRL